MIVVRLRNQRLSQDQREFCWGGYREVFCKAELWGHEYRAYRLLSGDVNGNGNGNSYGGVCYEGMMPNTWSLAIVLNTRGNSADVGVEEGETTITKVLNRDQTIIYHVIDIQRRWHTSQKQKQTQQDLEPSLYTIDLIRNPENVRLEVIAFHSILQVYSQTIHSTISGEKKIKLANRAEKSTQEWSIIWRWCWRRRFAENK